MLEIIFKVLDFVKEYYQVILIIIFLLSCLVALFTKRKKTDINFVRIFKLVQEAESKFPESGSGSLKLAYVISHLADLDPDYVCEKVEEILSSPQKK